VGTPQFSTGTRSRRAALPGLSAQSRSGRLKQPRPPCFGFVAFDTRNDWAAEILGGAEAELTSRRLSLLVSGLRSREPEAGEATVRSWFQERRVAGVIFAGPSPRERGLMQLARRAGVAVAVVGPNEPCPGCIIMRSDNLSAGGDIARHLNELSHRRVALIGGPPESRDSRERTRGLALALSAHGIEIVAEHSFAVSRYHANEGVQYADRWLATPRASAPTAIVLANDAMALGFMHRVQANGVSIPEDVSVIGFDDAPIARQVFPGLTTARQEMRRMGAEASIALTAMFRGDPPPPLVTTFPMPLVVRQSTGPAPRITRNAGLS
jgi:DNA-binding LacI/PurR family transcriptional regulator